jgi:hypothetical protein
MHIRTSRFVGWMAGIAVFALAVPVVLACVLPRTLSEQMTMAGDEVVVGTVQTIQETTAPNPVDPQGERAVWTVVSFHADESYVTGKKDFDVRVCFRGGVLPGSQTTSITPSPEDMRTGRKLLLFLAKRPFAEANFGTGSWQLDSYAECYRLFDVTDQGVQRRVVLGRGAGAAFPTNLTADDAHARIGEVLAQRGKK